MALQHFSHPQHPLVFNANERSGVSCQQCKEPIWSPSYNCVTCKSFYHHKLCAKLPLQLHHPLHPNHPLILTNKKWTSLIKEYYKCIDCNEFRFQYIYHCSHCNFSIHSRCSSFLLTIKSTVHKDHNHSLTCIWKLMKSHATFVAKKAICPFFVSYAILVYIQVVLLAYPQSKLHVTSTLSSSSIL